VILFCGIPSEPPMALAIQAAERIGIPHLVLNQRQYAHCDLLIRLEDSHFTGSLWLEGRQWPLDAFCGIYCRLMEAGDLPECRGRNGLQPSSASVRRAEFLNHLLCDWMDASPPLRVVNPPSAGASNQSKPYQALQIAEAGFTIPPTLITNHPPDVTQFAVEHGQLIYKSISSIRSIVQTFDPAANLERIRHLPTQFQKQVAGTDVRVHVIGNDVIATEIQSDGVDYRYAAAHDDGQRTRMTAAQLPRDVSDRCIALARSMSLPFCGIDLRRTPEGDYVCFEVNPAPAYSYFQEGAGQDIAGSLVRYLAGKEESYAGDRELVRHQRPGD